MATSNSEITFKGEKTPVSGRDVQVGDVIPDFTITANDLSDLKVDSFRDQVLVICSVPSVDTPVCDTEIKRFNQEVASVSADAAVLVVSADLPFAQKRWCAAEGVENVTTASDYKHRNFREAFGVSWDGPALLARAVFVVSKDGKIQHVEYVDDIASEPNYEAAIEKVKELV